MKLPKEDFRADARRSAEEGAWRLWIETAVHCLFQIQTLGFKLIVLIPGHYPLFSPVDRAVEGYTRGGGSSEVFVLTDRMYDESGRSGDHAAAFETSLMLALEPELVDLQELDRDPEVTPVGVLGEDPRVRASKEFGERILARFAEIVRARISEMQGP
jgi:creatinine amidohydrolase/Fe(II)-dependent formamide hydrolase-like protein